MTSDRFHSYDEPLPRKWTGPQPETSPGPYDRGTRLARLREGRNPYRGPAPGRQTTPQAKPGALPRPDSWNHELAPIRRRPPPARSHRYRTRCSSATQRALPRSRPQAPLPAAWREFRRPWPPRIMQRVQPACGIADQAAPDRTRSADECSMNSIGVQCKPNRAIGPVAAKTVGHDRYRDIWDNSADYAISPAALRRRPTDSDGPSALCAMRLKVWR